jgi:hypothetical protein
MTTTKTATKIMMLRIVSRGLRMGDLAGYFVSIAVHPLRKEISQFNSNPVTTIKIMIMIPRFVATGLGMGGLAGYFVFAAKTHDATSDTYTIHSVPSI